MTHVFPMARAGGLFGLIVGVGVILGGFIPGYRRQLLALGALLASTSLAVWAVELTRPVGAPTRLQVAALVGSIALEAVLIGLSIAFIRRRGERVFLLAILPAVGVHFVPMGLALGPLCAVLGICLAANAAVGIWLVPRAPLSYVWVVDGALKASFGGWMLLTMA